MTNIKSRIHNMCYNLRYSKNNITKYDRAQDVKFRSRQKKMLRIR